MSGTDSFLGDDAPAALPALQSGGADDVSGHPFGATTTSMRPWPVIRRRLQAVGAWTPLCAVLVRDHPDKMLELLSTETPNMVDITNPDVIAMVRLAGADPAVILA